MKRKMIFISLLATAPFAAEIKVDATVVYTSPTGVEEKCTILPEIVDGDYSKSDKEKEEKFCEVDFYEDSNFGLCPKTWSTSPGTIVYKLKGTSYEGSKQLFEKEVCGTSKTRSYKALAKFKNTMNQEGTSGTYAASNLLYYHFSRYLDTSVNIPVSVYREIDKSEHLKRAKLGQSSSPAGMIRNGWKWTVDAILNPDIYRPTSDLFTDDGEKVYGVMLKDSGERYGAEINGIRSKWGLQSSIDFKNTPAFVALGSSLDVETAISKTLSSYNENIKAEIKNHKGGLFKKKNTEALNNLNYLSKVLPLISKEQMIFWMKELTEITILDTIFSQQDRIGNIDYKWYAYFIDENGKVKNEKLDSDVALSKKSSLHFEAPNSSKVVFIQRTQLGDNDAGVRNAYMNFSKSAGLVEAISHLNARTYERVKALDADLSSEGEIFQYLSSNFGLKTSEITSIVKNTNHVFGILKQKCLNGSLKFDLEPKEFLKNQKVEGKTVSCE
ncbi:hypothetical protein [Bacteriovorax sp. Seq25_V]|uniref:hypothetical protein n=1 Tax=Bacteriovorax sp. Seq25_V TaxID=1201288 RepID=UPI00038A0FD9|nr:hypothetical protein [Bacteriovorax sp. Seq25_V]EQC47757.1 hypothetical protein M900_A0199 [Bacteriovorax sp. Seq25_V]